MGRWKIEENRSWSHEKHLERFHERSAEETELPDQDSNLDKQNQNLLC